MEDLSDWKRSLGAADRYGTITKLKQAFELKGLAAGQDAQNAAFTIESDAYDTSMSRIQEEYDRACKPCSTTPAETIEEYSGTRSPGTAIGSYQNCHHIAEGLISEVYRSNAVALKVITETRNVDPHNPAREAKILSQLSHSAIIKITETFKDHEGRLVLVFPYIPLTLARVIGTGNLSNKAARNCFHDIFSALSYLHDQEIIHRDIKPSNVLLSSVNGPAYLADFGTAWHPRFSATDEPASHKVLEVGTTCYRAPETLFGNRSYGPSLDMWAAGTMLAECLRTPHKTLFESRDTSEDGNQLGLILSIFKTIGTPTKETWPEAINFTTPPFEWYREFPGQSWEDLLPEVDKHGRDLVARLVCYESASRMTSTEALQHPYFAEHRSSLASVARD